MTMAKYLVSGSYSAEGLKGVLKGGGTARVDAVRKMVEGMGGSLESFYFAFGGEDVFIIVDMPDNASVAAVAMTASSTGQVGVKTVVLLTAGEIDEAAKRQVNYKPPA
jgi:uncharacterized protein with GYD domain